MTIITIQVTDPKPVIIADEDDVIRCGFCKRWIGTQTSRNGRAVLQIDGVLLWSMHGFCSCGEEFHWQSSDVKLNRIVNS